MTDKHSPSSIEEVSNGKRRRENSDGVKKHKSRKYMKLVDTSDVKTHKLVEEKSVTTPYRDESQPDTDRFSNVASPEEPKPQQRRKKRRLTALVTQVQENHARGATDGTIAGGSAGATNGAVSGSRVSFSANTPDDASPFTSKCLDSELEHEGVNVGAKTCKSSERSAKKVKKKMKRLSEKANGASTLTERQASHEPQELETNAFPSEVIEEPVGCVISSTPSCFKRPRKKVEKKSVQSDLTRLTEASSVDPFEISVDQSLTGYAASKKNEKKKKKKIKGNKVQESTSSDAKVTSGYTEENEEVTKIDLSTRITSDHDLDLGLTLPPRTFSSNLAGGSFVPELGQLPSLSKPKKVKKTKRSRNLVSSEVGSHTDNPLVQQQLSQLKQKRKKTLRKSAPNISPSEVAKGIADAPVEEMSCAKPRKNGAIGRKDKLLSESWSKKEGLNLQWDKHKVFKKVVKGELKEELSLIKQPQVHVGKDSCLKNKRSIKPETESWRDIKPLALNNLRQIVGLPCVEQRRKALRILEGQLYHVQFWGGDFSDSEADEIVDVYVQCRERETIHPLQTYYLYGRRYATTSGLSLEAIFTHPTMRRALRRRGYYLNVGDFSSLETLTLANNFEGFLKSRGLSTNRTSIWNLLTDDFGSFYRKTNLFLQIGSHLNRCNSQIYSKLRGYYQPFKRGLFSAKEDAVILLESKRLRVEGLTRRFKMIGANIGRYSRSVNARHEILERKEKGAVELDSLVNAIAKAQNVQVSELHVDGDLHFDQISAELGHCSADLRHFWEKEGKLRYQKSLLPKWTHQDNLALLSEIEAVAGEEDDENCIDFEQIYKSKKTLQGKVADWKQLREKYNALRRSVNYYLLKDLKSIVSLIRKDLKGMESRDQ